jgi:enoyl-CoA hydratase
VVGPNGYHVLLGQHLRKTDVYGRLCANGITFNQIAETGTVLQVAKDMASNMSKRPGLSLGIIKKTVNYGEMNGIEAGQAYALPLSDQIFASQDIREGVAAYFEKRPPVFRHC